MATAAEKPSVRMLRIRKISGQELPAISIENIRDIGGLKHELSNLHGFPFWMQRLLHNGNCLDDSTKLDMLLDGSSLDESAQPDPLDASIHLQLVLATASTAAERKETNELFLVACQDGEVETALLLLQAGADKNVRDGKGRTAVMLATCNGHTEIVRWLLQAGAGKNMRDGEGRTALMWAARNGHAGITRLLLQDGAKKDLQDHERVTALMEAACSGHVEIAHLLLQAGAKKAFPGSRARDSSDGGSLQVPRRDRAVAAASWC